MANQTNKSDNLGSMYLLKRRPGKVGMAKSTVIAEMPLASADEEEAYKFFEKYRWGTSAPGSSEACCPHCGDIDVYTIKDRLTGGREKNYRWRCRGCQRLYSVRTGTVMEQSRIPLRFWAYAFWRSVTSKKGVSSLEIARQTGLSYKSALFLMNRVRWAMRPPGSTPAPGSKLTGIVEVDETFIGGKPRYSIPQKGHQGITNYQTKMHRKAAVFGAVQRNGAARIRVIPDVKAHTLRQAVMDHIDLSARLMTDEASAYKKLGKEFAGHDQIQHKNNIYVRGDISTNTIESFWALLKRGIIGIYHNVSRKHLQRYLDEFEFRYNHRKMDDGERVLAVIRGSYGKRLVMAA